MSSSVQGGLEGLSARDTASAAAAGSDVENADPKDAQGSLKRMWQQQEGIATHRTDNLFQSLEERMLTDEEQCIIEQRVALQRKMFEEYERRERKRKVAELREVCPDISEDEACKALEMCDGREDDAAVQLVSDPAFKRRAQAACCVVPAPVVAAAPAPRKELIRQSSRLAKPAGPRPKIVDPATLGGNVFVGAFRGKGFKPPPKGRALVRKPAAATSRQLQQEADKQRQEEGEEEETASEDEEQEQQSGEQQEPGFASQCSEEEQQAPGFEVEQQKQQEQPAASGGASLEQQQQQQPGVLLWPRAQDVAAEQPQRYVLVQADTLQAPTDALLHAARRQLGESSDSRVAPCSTADEKEAAPASAAWSRPRESVSHEVSAEGETAMPSAIMLMAMSNQLAKLNAGKAKALLQNVPSDVVRASVLEGLDSADAGQVEACQPLLTTPVTAAATADLHVVEAAAGEEQEQQQEGTCSEQETAVPASQRGGGSRRTAAGAHPASKRAVSAPLSDNEEPETEVDPSEASSEEEEESSDADFSAAPSRGNRRAHAQPAEQRVSRPSRAAKQAAAAAFVAYANYGDEGSDAEMAEAVEASSDEEAQPARRIAAKSRRSGRATEPVHAAGSSRKVPAKKKQKLEQGTGAMPALAATEQQLCGMQQGGSSDSGHDMQQRQQQQPACEESPGADPLAASVPLPRVRAISSTGHTCRGRVKQKSHKSADLVRAGSLRAEKGWYNAGYIFPEGFQSRTLFRSSVAIDQLCVHECHVIGKQGQYWPQPTFMVVALDRPQEPLIAKSCTGCWTGILKRINAEIEARRKAGEDLPPPPKTAIAGPEYFGLNQPNIQEAVEGLDPGHLCTEYWAGKADRQRAAAGLPVTSVPARAPRAPRPPSNGGSKRSGGGSSKGRSRRRGGSDSEDEEQGEGEEDETQFMTNKWSAVSRSDRYRKRLQENGDDTSALDEDNPLPHFIDPITMGAVVRPAITPYGYVAGLATWKVVLAEKQQCPFTNQPLQFEQLKVLTKTNIHLHRDKIVNGNIHGRSSAM